MSHAPSHRPCAPLIALLFAAAACTSPGESITTNDDNALTETATPRAGSTIDSPSVDPTKMYWGARSIGMLERIGYLSREEGAVARRADGIRGNSPANERIGVDELAALESPEHVGTLFPEERAVIAKLWKILLIDDVPAHSPSALAIPTVVKDGYSTAPFAMPIASLPAGQQPLARRIELTQDSDSDPETISGGDVAGAYADAASYLPSEIGAMRALHQAIAEAAPSLAHDAQHVEVPADTGQVLATLGPVELVANPTTSVVRTFNGDRTRLPVLVANARIEVKSSDPAFQIVTLDRETGQDAIAPATAPVSVAKASRVELWKDGVRTAAVDVEPTGEASAPIPFGYAVKIGDATYAMKCTGSACSYAQTSQLGARAGSAIPPTSYFIGGGEPYRLDVFPSGRALLVGGGATATCFPPGNSSINYVKRCVAYGADGQEVASIDLGPDSSGEDPRLGRARFAGSSTPRPLYAY